MKFTALLLASITLLAGCGALPGGEGSASAQHISGFDYGMQPVSNRAGDGQRAHGWRYFSDPATTRAVVISPQGDYYLSRGQGLRWVAGTPTDI